jgi:hypothetical protein
LGDPVQLLTPEGVALLTQKDEQREVLRKRVGQFDVSWPVSAWRLDPTGEDPIKTAGLWLKWVYIIGGDAVVDVQLRDPGQVVVHGSGSEAACLPVGEKLVNPSRASLKGTPVTIKLSVMIKVMDEHIESAVEKRAP